MHVIYMGDSGLIICISKENSYKIVFKTTEQQHFFNCPYQLAKLPGPGHFDELEEAGFNKLVNAAKKF